MPGKIANTLGDEKVARMCEELRATSATPTLKQFREMAAKYGVPVSNDGAATFRDNTFKAHLERLRNGREKTATILAAIRETDSPLTAFEEVAAADILDSYTSGDDEVDRDQLIKAGATLRSAISEREASARAERDLGRKLADSEAKRAGDERRIALLEERLQLVQFDAASAALAHAQELRAISADASLDSAQKLERARIRLFGETPAGTKTLREIDDERKQKGAA